MVKSSHLPHPPPPSKKIKKHLPKRSSRRKSAINNKIKREIDYCRCGQDVWQQSLRRLGWKSHPHPYTPGDFTFVAPGCDKRSSVEGSTKYTRYQSLGKAFMTKGIEKIIRESVQKKGKDQVTDGKVPSKAASRGIQETTRVPPLQSKDRSGMMVPSKASSRQKNKDRAHETVMMRKVPQHEVVEDCASNISASDVSQDSVIVIDVKKEAPDPISVYLPMKTDSLKTRIKGLEQQLFGNSYRGDGMIASRIREMEVFLFRSSYIPPCNLTSRVDSIAHELV